MRVRLFFLLILVGSVSANARGIECFVDIDDGTTTGKQRIIFKMKESAAGSRVNFTALAGKYRCNLYFSDLRHGTSLACELIGDLGRTFIQSDRSAIKEASQVNTLTFRVDSAQIVDLRSDCSL
jgi:hypothetical protein